MKSVRLEDAVVERLPELREPEVQKRIAEICMRHNICRLSLFGSALRDDFSTGSDVDLLVEFAPDNQVGLIQLAQVEIELTDLLGREVDLRTSAELSRYFRNQVKESARELYTA